MVEKSVENVVIKYFENPCFVTEKTLPLRGEAAQRSPSAAS
jgi:hypothetical protein